MKNRFCNQFCKINIIIDCVIFVHFPCKIKIKAKCLGTRMVDKKTEHITKQLFRAFYTNNFGRRLQCNHEVFHSFLLSCKNYIFYVMIAVYYEAIQRCYFYYKSLVIALERYYFSKWKEEKPGDSCILILLCSSLLIFVSGRSRRKNIASALIYLWCLSQHILLHFFATLIFLWKVRNVFLWTNIIIIVCSNKCISKWKIKNRL